MSTVRVKICGLTRAADVHAALEAGVHAVGFVFAASRRRIEPRAARELARQVPGRVLRVGLFMDQEPSAIEAVLERVPLDWLQFHGAETDAFCRGFGLPFLKAVPMGSEDAASEALKYPGAAGLLMDSHDVGGAGGSGAAFDWSLVPECRQRVWLAGGLHAGNVGRAIRQVRPWAVDVSSGVEDAPGIKNAAKIEAFMQAVRAACDEPWESFGEP